MKKVIFITSTLTFGGAEIQTIALANRLAVFHKVMIICLSSDTDLKNRLSDQTKVVVLNKRSYLDITAVKEVYSRFQTFMPDYVFFANSYPMLYGFLAKLFIKRDFKTFLIQHTTILHNVKGKLQNRIYLGLMKKLDCIIFICNNQKKYWTEKYHIDPTKSNVIYNGIDIDHYVNYSTDTASIRRKMNFSDTDIIIGINAILRPEKRHKDLIGAVALLKSEGYPVKLLIIGDGPRRNAIEEYLNKKGLKDSAFITGFVEDVRPYVACTSISAMTSISETLSVAVLESMAMRKPIVMSDVGGARELVIHGENGYLYKAGDIKELYQYLKYMIDRNIVYDMGDRSLELVKENFSFDKTIQSYLDIVQ